MKFLLAQLFHYLELLNVKSLVQKHLGLDI
ncbi:Uncharacterised protein [Legionella pneumophila]|nr:Uncharacterised protein [Legionella pneumophila]CZI64711.1 Uncharacterised protein [Legionella pneumophila]CZJ10550.1 Uncharacterised protein [Legionella pneumophila]CZJ16402.1 Uncharacterised protein [Legionella pneumophila]STX70036.1 Uncharacterised protein [Legionella pneumophila]